ncbi:MAG: hypothetical protein Q9195_004842 [Heterodermia aff. obscurata]
MSAQIERKKEKNSKKGNDPKKDSEAPKQPEAGGKGNEIPPANAPAASTTKATTTSTPAVAPTTSAASTVARITLPATSAAICTSENEKKKNENIVQSIVPLEQAPKDISRSAHGLFKAIADTENTTTSTNKTTELSSKEPRDKSSRTKHEAAKNKTTPENTGVEKDSKKIVFKPKPNPDDEKL